MRMMCLLFAAGALLSAAAVAPARGSGHPEVTPIALGVATLRSGEHEEWVALPADVNGCVDHALVLIARRPQMATPEKSVKTVDAAITFRISGKALPVWTLTDEATAFVINLDTIKANPEYRDGRLRFVAETRTDAPATHLSLIGMPDPLLAGSAVDGPIDALIQAAPDDDVRDYMRALQAEFTGRFAEAAPVYRRLSASRNARLAALARGGARLAAYREWARRLSGEFSDHFDWGLYLQQCGLFAASQQEFNESRILEPTDSESLFRMGETLLRLNYPVAEGARVLAGAGNASGSASPNVWNVLVVLVKSRTDPDTVGGVQNPRVLALSDEDLVRLKNDWVAVEHMVWGATGGMLRLSGAFFDRDGLPPGTESDPTTMLGVIEGLVEHRGWFDGVIVIQPRLPTDLPNEAESLTLVGEAGPRGVGLSLLFADASWRDMLVAWYRQFAGTARLARMSTVVPQPPDVFHVGHTPAPAAAFGVLSAMHYVIPRDEYRRLDAAGDPAPNQHVRFWRIEGPWDSSSLGVGGGRSLRAAVDGLPKSPRPLAGCVDADAEFIDLGRFLGTPGPALALATTWVFSPKDQEVRMWLGQNGRAAAWVNGRCVYEGGYAGGAATLLDTAAAAVSLARGWNELRVGVETAGATGDARWGFSVRLCDFQNAPVSGLAFRATPPDSNLAPRFVPPAAGRHYRWSRVRTDHADALPRLTEADLRAITGDESLSVVGLGEGGFGCVAVDGLKPRSPVRRRKPPDAWDRTGERDSVVNNVLDWSREACAVWPYERGGQARELLLVKPAAWEAFSRLLREARSAAPPVAAAANRTVADRMWGYLVVPTPRASRVLFVADVSIGEPDAWPIDEVDLLVHPAW